MTTAEGALKEARARREMTDEEIARWLPLVEKTRKVRFWGATYTVTPKLVPFVWGDGKQWMCLEPLNTRPNYYVLCIDSRVSLDDLDADEAGVDFHDLLSDVLDAIEDAFGRADDAEAEDADENGMRAWPALNDSSGLSWGEHETPQTSPSSEPR